MLHSKLKNVKLRFENSRLNWSKLRCPFISETPQLCFTSGGKAPLGLFAALREGERASATLPFPERAGVRALFGSVAIDLLGGSQASFRKQSRELTVDQACSELRQQKLDQMATNMRGLTNSLDVTNAELQVLTTL